MRTARIVTDGGSTEIFDGIPCAWGAIRFGHQYDIIYLGEDDRENVVRVGLPKNSHAKRRIIRSDEDYSMFEWAGIYGYRGWEKDNGRVLVLWEVARCERIIAEKGVEVFGSYTGKGRYEHYMVVLALVPRGKALRVVIHQNKGERKQPPLIARNEEGVVAVYKEAARWKSFP